MLKPDEIAMKRPCKLYEELLKTIMWICLFAIITIHHCSVSSEISHINGQLHMIEVAVDRLEGE